MISGRTGGLRRDEGGAPGVKGGLGAAIVGRRRRMRRGGPPWPRQRRVSPRRGRRGSATSSAKTSVGISRAASKSACWPSRSCRLRFRQARATALSSPVSGLVSGVGDPGRDELGRRAEEAVAALDVGVEERERLAGLEGLEPEADLAQLDGHRVEVDGVDAVGDDVAQGMADGGGGGLALARADRRQALGEPVGGGDEEVPGARGRVDDRELEDRPLGASRSLPRDRLVDDRVEGGVEQAVDQARRRVVGAGRLALVAGGRRRARSAAGWRRSRCAGAARAGPRRCRRAPRRRGCGSRRARSRRSSSMVARARTASRRSSLRRSAPSRCGQASGRTGTSRAPAGRAWARPSPPRAVDDPAQADPEVGVAGAAAPAGEATRSRAVE